MGFKKVCHKRDKRSKRGGGADGTIDDLVEYWDVWRAGFAEAAEEDRDEVVQEFEAACTDAGAAIQLEAAAEFSAESKAWGTEDRENFAAVLGKYFGEE